MRGQAIESDDNSFESHEFIEERVIQANGVLHRKIYQKMRALNDHSTGKYYEIKDINEKHLYRAKVIYKSQLKTKDKNRLLAQITNQRMFDHPNFIKLENVFEDNLCVYLLTEIFPNGSLEDLLQRRGRLSEQQVAFYFKNLIDILVQLRKQKVMHRDIKLQSLYLGDEMILKLGEFGSSCSHEGERRKSILKLNHYSSPEIINQSGHSHETDLWSVGVITYRMLVGTEPFRVGDTFSITKIQNANVFFPEDIPISYFWKDTLKRILVYNQSQRISLSELSLLDIPQLPIYLPKYLLNVPNRLPCYFQRKKPKLNSTFTALREINFKDPQTQNQKSKVSTNKLIRSQLIKSIAMEISMTASRAVKKVNFAVVEDWIISTDTISYVIGCFACVNFADKTRVYNSFSAVYYQNSEGVSNPITEEVAMANKTLHRKYRFHQSMLQSFQVISQQVDAVCPFFVEKVYVQEKYLVFSLTNGYYQLCFNDQPKQCYLMVSKGKILFYIKGKQADNAGSRIAEVERIMNSFKKMNKQ